MLFIKTLQRFVKSGELSLKAVFAVIVTVLMPSLLRAHDFESNGIYYNIVGDEAEVTYKGSDYNNSPAYKGVISIPSKVSYQNKSYKVSRIGDHAFFNCASLTKITIPSSILSIGKNAFLRCSGLTEIGLPSQTRNIGEGAFSGCEKLKTVTLSEGLEKISGSAFYNCIGIEGIEIPSTVKSIGHLAFYGCNKLQNINFLSTPDYFGANVFGNCNLLKRDNKGNLIVNDGKILCYLGAYESTIPEDIEIIGGYAIGGNLSELSIPDKVKFIGEGAINCANLKKLTLGKGLKYIDGHLFTNYSANPSPLEEITINASMPPECLKGDPEALYAFDNHIDTEKCILYVPSSSIDLYKNAPQWNKFRQITPIPISGLRVEYSGEGCLYTHGDIVANGSEFDEGELQILILPNDGNRIEAISLNGDNVLGSMKNHIFTIADCKNCGVLNVLFAPVREASLTVRGADTHSLVHYYSEGSTAKIDLLPEDGWSLYSLLFNGVEVINDVVENTYTTPELRGDNIIEVVMSMDITTEIKDIKSEHRNISIRKTGDLVEFFNLDEDETISIYNADGVCEYHGSSHAVMLRHNCVYILRTAKEILKFSI